MGSFPMFSLKTVASFNSNSEDPVTCFVGTTEFLICGTEKGKIIRFRYENNSLVYYDNLPSPIQIALATNRQSILRCEVSITTAGVNVDVQEKIETNAEVRCLAANERGICYATTDHYFVFDWQNTRDHHELMSLDECTPQIRSFNNAEFIICGPNGVNVFVAPNGTSNRQPICAEMLVVDACLNGSILYLIDDTEIFIHDVEDENVRFSITSEKLRFVTHACHRFFFLTSDKKVRELVLGEEFVQTAQQLLLNDTHSGLQLIEVMKAVCGRNEAVLEACNLALLNAGSEYLKSGKAEIFVQLVGRMQPEPQLEELIEKIPSARFYYETVLPLQRSVMESEQLKKSVDLKAALDHVIRSNDLARRRQVQSVSIRFTPQDPCNVCKKPLEAENVTLGPEGAAHTRCTRLATFQIG
ncbi:hypothetical protein M3Y99_00394800 [Aphelenchoides fujianensis]|nr:hypothetical protein M3Y99_00394800 [Aphelenchoides fujianensis]